MKRPASARGRRYYIRRKSMRAGDETGFFCDENGRRIVFDKVSHAAFLITSFAEEQAARVVCLQADADDRPFAEYLPGILPGYVRPEEYLAAVEKIVRDRRSGRDISRRELRALERFWR